MDGTCSQQLFLCPFIRVSVGKVDDKTRTEGDSAGSVTWRANCFRKLFEP